MTLTQRCDKLLTERFIMLDEELESYADYIECMEVDSYQQDCND